MLAMLYILVNVILLLQVMCFLLYKLLLLLLLLYTIGLRVFSRCEDVAKDRNTKETSSMDCRERGSHARGVYPTQYTSRMETARVKEGVGADTRIIVKG